MNRNRVLLAFIVTCLVVAVAQAQVATAPAPGQRGGRGARSGATDNVLDLLAPLAATQNAQGRGGSAANGAWWTDTALMTRLGLTDLQKLRIEGAFQAYRLNLTAAKETLEKEEALLSRFLDAESVDRSAVLLQVNKVIQARSEMERVNATMTLEMREQLTRAQWAQLQGQPAGGRGGRGAAPAGPPAADSFAAKYAADKPITLEGTVTQFKFLDPHSYIVFDVVGKDGKITSWTGELGGSTNLTRQGWNSTMIKPGERIVVEGSQAHDPSLNAVNIRSVRRVP